MCEWCDRYYINAEEQEHFWKRIQKELCQHCGLHGTSHHYHQKGYNLYNTKSYVWPLGGESFVFKIGLNPLRSFRVEIILERENQTEYIDLNKTTVNDLFSVIHKLYRLDECHPELHSDSTSNTGCVNISVYNCDLYNLSIENRSMKVNDKNLLGLVDLQPWIIEILQIYEFERIKAEFSLFRLLEVLAEKKKTLRPSELGDLITTPCAYVPIGFIIEMITQHFDLLLQLLVVYQDTRASNQIAG